MPPSRSPQPPSEDLVLALLVVDAGVARAQRTLDAAKADRDRVRARAKRFFPDDQYVELAGLGKRIRRKTKSTGRTFSLTRYEAKHPITPEMEAFIGKGSSYDDWRIEDLAI